MIERNDQVETYIGGYRVIVELATSPVSCTLLGETVSESDKRHVVIKWLSMAHLVSQEEKKRFLHEISVLKRLEHPQLAPILAAGLYVDTPYIVTPYAIRGTLADRVHAPETQPLSQQQVIAIVMQIGQVLNFLHQQDIVHGNLKLENVLFKTATEIQLTDFRLSCLQPVGPGIQEMSASGKGQDLRALAGIMYELLTGHKPIVPLWGSDPGIRYRTLLALRQVEPPLSPHVEKALLTALVPEATRTHYDINAFLQAFAIPPETPLIVTEETMPLHVLEQESVTSSATTTAALPLVGRVVESVGEGGREGRAVVLYGSPGSRDGVRNFAQRRTARLLLVCVGIVLFGVIGTQLFALLSSRFSMQHYWQDGAQRTQVVTPHVVKPTMVRTVGPTVTPTVDTVEPTVVVRTPTPVVVPVSGFVTTPAYLAPRNCTVVGQKYVCILTLTLRAHYGWDQRWSGMSSKGLGATFSPAGGVLQRGASIRVMITIPRNCPHNGTVSFVGSNTSITLLWNC